MTAHLTYIQIFPVKSLDPCPVDEASVLPTGALQHDRQFALIDAAGNFINGKRTPLVHSIRARFDFKEDRLHLEVDGEEKVFHMNGDRSALEGLLSCYFSMPMKVLENKRNGFPDDLNAPGPTVISTATLETVASWFEITLDDARLRFRANLEIGGVEPFWEDRLYGETGQVVPFQVGNVLFEGVTPCQRCVVPSRNPKTAQAIAGFQKVFVERRKQSFPSWAIASRFDHFYRLAVNTKAVRNQVGVPLMVGDEVRILARQ